MKPRNNTERDKIILDEEGKTQNKTPKRGAAARGAHYFGRGN